MYCGWFLSCNENRRLNNNSLSGPFPVSLAKIPRLAFLWVWVYFLSLLSFCLYFHVSLSWKLKNLQDVLILPTVFLYFLIFWFAFWSLHWFSRDLSYNNLSGPVPKFPARTFKYVSLHKPVFGHYLSGHLLFLTLFCLLNAVLWAIHWFVEVAAMKVYLDMPMLVLFHFLSIHQLVIFITPLFSFVLIYLSLLSFI